VRSIKKHLAQVDELAARGLDVARTGRQRRVAARATHLHKVPVDRESAACPERTSLDANICQEARYDDWSRDQVGTSRKVERGATKIRNVIVGCVVRPPWLDQHRRRCSECSTRVLQPGWVGSKINRRNSSGGVQWGCGLSRCMRLDRCSWINSWKVVMMPVQPRCSPGPPHRLRVQCDSSLYLLGEWNVTKRSEELLVVGLLPLPFSSISPHFRGCTSNSG
jgi:hypothetical protein